MPKKNPLAVPIQEFLGDYADIWFALHDRERKSLQSQANAWTSLFWNPGEDERFHYDPDLWEKVQRWWPVRVLRLAADEDPEQTKRLLYFWLRLLEVKLPEGVLVPFRGKPGRPRKDNTAAIVATWTMLGKPYLSGQLLARKVFGESFTSAPPSEKNRLVNQCRRAVERSVPRDQIPRPIKANKISRP
jgi:hypothetical protein